jgi:hypothetical protein
VAETLATVAARKTRESPAAAALIKAGLAPGTRLDSLEPGDVLRTLLEAAARELATISEQLGRVYESAFIDTGTAASAAALVDVIQTGARSDPDVILDVVFEDGLLYLALRNLGCRPALDVSCSFDKPFRGLGGERPLNELRLFRKLPFLAPGREIRTLLDSTAAYFARREPARLQATLSWRTTAGEKRRTTIVHDLAVYRELAYVPRGAPDA